MLGVGRIAASVAINLVSALTPYGYVDVYGACVALWGAGTPVIAAGLGIAVLVAMAIPWIRGNATTPVWAPVSLSSMAIVYAVDIWGLPNEQHIMMSGGLVSPYSDGTQSTIVEGRARRPGIDGIAEGGSGMAAGTLSLVPATTPRPRFTSLRSSG